MHKTIKNKALIITVCCLMAFGAAYAYVQKTSEDVCRAADRQKPAAESIGDDLPWESLSRQFVYSVID